MRGPTEIQAFAMGLLYRALGEDTINRTPDDYELIKSRIPTNLKRVHQIIIDELARYAQTDEFKKSQFCRFKAGDEIIRFESYPTSISIETVNQALIVCGWRQPRSASR